MDEISTLAASKTLNGDIRQKSDSLLDLSTALSESDTNNNEAKKTVVPKTENGIPSVPQADQSKQAKPAFIRAPSLDRFNARVCIF